MFITNGAAERARWAVMWIYVKRGRKRLFRKDFADDIASAEELFHKALEAKKPYATLACVNMGFPPPVKLRPHSVRKKGRDKRTRRIKTVLVEVSPLKELNLNGTLWCPYCRQLRKFVLRKTATVGSVHMVDPRYACPICGISHRDHNVRLWNPTAVLHMSSSLAARTRVSSKATTRRRRRARA